MVASPIAGTGSHGGKYWLCGCGILSVTRHRGPGWLSTDGKFLKGPRHSGDRGDQGRPRRQSIKEMEGSERSALGFLRLVPIVH